MKTIQFIKSAWVIEVLRLVVLFVFSSFVGFIFSAWSLGIIIGLSLYVIWVFIQINRFESWIKKGAHSKEAPQTSGIWHLIVQHIYQTHKKNRERKKSLASLASRYQSIIKALPDATVVLNEKLEIVWGNKASEDILGITLTEDIGKQISEKFSNPKINELLNCTEQYMEVESVSPKEQQKRLVFTKVQYGDKQTLLIARDISARIALQKMRKAFIANASHELRTPLTVISGYLEMLACDEDLPEGLNKIVNNAHTQALRMDSILNALLILSKLEEKGRNEDSGELLDAPNLINQIVLDFQKSKNRNTHSIKLKVDETLLIKMVEMEFYSLFQNLLSNAYKYSDDGSEIFICWSKDENGQACLTVKDCGEGIAGEHLERLTERFYRVSKERSRKVGGTGLGLSIVKHIIENNGGFLDIKSELNVGSTFTACFPKYRIQYQENPEFV